jgi:hypothetical protein
MALAERAIKEIETAEKKPILQLENNRINEYIARLQEFLIERTPESNVLHKDAEKMLRRMRNQHT